MKILVGWDDPAEAELLQMYLDIGGENEVCLCDNREAIIAAANRTYWDVALLSQGLPTIDDGYAIFKELHKIASEIPVVLGCRADGIIGLPRFLKSGVRSYVIRDERGDFLFLLLAALESAVAAVVAERASAVAEMLKHELDGVRKLQETIIPRGLVCPPGYRAVARYEPAEMQVAGGGKPVVMAGGDYYEVFPADNHTLVALVGDASGHGLKACMSIISMHTLIHMMTNHRYADTGTFVGDINKRLCDNAIVQSGGGFITLFYGAIDTVTHEMHWTSAGHPPALLHDRKTNNVYPVGGINDGGLPLGITGEMGYDVMTCKVPEGSRILIFSDGLTDALAPNSGGKLFGMDGIVQTLKANCHSSLEETLDALFKDSRDFTQGDGRHDDTSVVLVERN